MVADLGGGDVKRVVQARQQRFEDAAFLFQRVDFRKIKLDGEQANDDCVRSH